MSKFNCKNMLNGGGRELSAQKSTPRNSNLELLRIIAMALIVLFHYQYHGGFEWENVPFSGTKILTLFIGGFGKIGVVLFVLISSYFVCELPFKLKNVVSLIVKTWVFSVTILVLFEFVVPSSDTITWKTAIKAFLPITYGMYWFVTDFIVLMFLSPFLNKLLKTLSRKAHLSLILLLGFIWVVCPTFIYGAFGITYIEFNLFFLLYFVAAYLRFYPPAINVRRHVFLAIFWAGVLFLSILMLAQIDSYIPIFNLNGASKFTWDNMLPAFMFAIEFFLIFVQMKPRFSRFVNTIAGTTFGIYLIHDNNAFVRPFLWSKLFKNAEHWDTPLFFVHFIGVSALVFVGCSLIDYIFWQKTFGKLANFLIDKYLPPISEWIIVNGTKAFCKLRKWV